MRNNILGEPMSSITDAGEIREPLKDHLVFEKKKPSKEKIFVESAKLFAIKGYYGTSVRDIAKAAGVNVALINYHFKSKENLFIEVAGHGLKVVDGAIAQSAGLPVQKIIDRVYQLSTDLNTTGYYVAVIFSMFTGGFDRKEAFLDLITKKRTHFEQVLSDAIIKDYDLPGWTEEVSKVAWQIVVFTTANSCMRFGTGTAKDTGYVGELFPDAEETTLALIQDMVTRVCSSLKK